MKHSILSLLMLIILVGCKPKEDVGVVQQALDNIKDKNAVTEFVVSGNPVGEDWLILRKLNNELPNVESIILKDATFITSRAFVPDGVYENTWLKKIKAPKVKTLYDEALYGCKKLVEIDLPELNKVGKFSFGFCESITSITLTKLKVVAERCFAYCYSLKTFDIPLLERLEEGSFIGCESIEILSSNKIKEIPDHCFAHCLNLKKIDTPNVELAGKEAFRGCKMLEEINMPALLRAEESSFNYCLSLERVSFPNLQYIGNTLFGFSTNLKELKLLTESLIVVEKNWWDFAPADVELYLHANNYQNAQNNTWNGVMWKNIFKVD